MNFLLASNSADFLLSQDTGGGEFVIATLILSGLFLIVSSGFLIWSFKDNIPSGKVFFGIVTLVVGALFTWGIFIMAETGDLEGNTRETIHEIESEYHIEVYSNSLKNELMDLSSSQLKDNTTFLVEGFTYVYDGQMYSTDLTIAYTAESRFGPTISLYSTGDSTRGLTAFDPANGFITSDAPEAGKSGKSDTSEKELEPFGSD